MKVILVDLRCLSVRLVPSDSPANEEASWLWCLAAPSAERSTLPVSGNAQQTTCRTERRRHGCSTCCQMTCVVCAASRKKTRTLCCTHPNLNRVATVGKTVTSAREKDCPARWVFGPSLKERGGTGIQEISIQLYWHSYLNNLHDYLQICPPAGAMFHVTYFHLQSNNAFSSPKRNRTKDRAKFVSFRYLLQVTLPQLEFSDQSFLVSL